METQGIDAMTGLANQRKFGEEYANSRLQWLHDERVTFFSLDIDWLRYYNDGLGHEAGDTCIIAIAGIVQEAFGKFAGKCCRSGGDEFVGYVVEIDDTVAARIGLEIIEAVDNLDLWCVHHPVKVGISVGVCTSIANQKTFQEHLIGADRALYTAKESGRHRVVVQSDD